LRIFVLLALASLSACSWFHPRPKPPPPAPELVVTGAPVGSTVYVDDVQNGQTKEVIGKPQVLTVAAGAHIVEVRTGSTVIYREQTFVSSGETRVIKVLSGLNRE
jgi:hypothetical protein